MPDPAENQSELPPGVPPPTSDSVKSDSPVQPVARTRRHRLTILVAAFLVIGLPLLLVFVRPWLVRQDTSREVDKTARIFRGLKGDAWSLAFTPDGRFIASPSGNSVELRNVQTGRFVRSFDGHTDPVMRIAISPDGRHLASTSMD